MTPQAKNRIRAYASQRNVSTVGAWKNETATARLVAKLTPRQQRRLARKAA